MEDGWEEAVDDEDGIGGRNGWWVCKGDLDKEAGFESCG